VLKIVLDTNIYISGIFWEGLPRIVLDLARDGKIEVFVSPAILKELHNVLTGKKFSLSQKESDRILKDILSYTTPVTPGISEKIEIPDQRDVIILETVLSGKADYLITGDPHLLNLHTFKGIKIVKVREFLSLEFPELL